MQLWTVTHAVTLIPAALVMLAASVGLRYWLGKKDEKIRMIPFQVLAGILLALEIGKQITSLVRGYNFYHLPFHFCSLFIFFLPLMAFYRGKGEKFLRSFTTASCCMMTVFLLVYPNLIYSDGAIKNMFRDYFDFHAVVFHNIVLFEFMLIYALRLYETDTKRDAKTMLVGFVAYSVLAGAMAQVFQENYNNFYRCSIGPLYSVQEWAWNAMGYGLGQFVYVVGVLIATVGFAFATYWICRGIEALCKKIYNLIKKEETA